MWFRAPVCDRMTRLAARVLPAVFPAVFPAVLALPLLLLDAPSAAVAETATGPRAANRAELEQRVMDTVRMFEKDPRYNRGKTPQQIKDGVEFVTGNVLFVLGHETAHALISEFGIPVLGREEDAADALATIVALKMSNAFADRVVINAARGWFLGDQRDRKEGVPITYYDEHGMDLQRAYNIVCLLVGGAPDKFEGLANEVKLPEERQGTCQGDYSNASWSWEQALKSHIRKPDDPKTKIEVSYAPTQEYAALAEHGRNLKILESVAEWLSDDFAWKKPISLEMQECGSPGARWDLTTKQVIVCYELIREFVQLHRKYGQAALVPGTPKMSKNKKVIMAAQPNGGKNRAQKSFRSQRARR
jgi:Putative metallopeptidase